MKTMVKVRRDEREVGKEVERAVGRDEEEVGRGREEQ
jgi:hypothetical protein